MAYGAISLRPDRRRVTFCGGREIGEGMFPALPFAVLAVSLLYPKLAAWLLALVAVELLRRWW